MRIGFAGLGRMGASMAERLASLGGRLTIWNRSPEKAAAVAASTGAIVAATPALLAASSDIVVTMLADDDASSAVHLGTDGLFAGAAGALTVVEMGTVSPAHIAALDAAAPQGVRVVDAPVSGATEAAINGALTIMVGAPPGDTAALEPLFRAMGHHTIHLGALGHGAVMKLSVNGLLHAINGAFCEAVCLAENAGITTEKAFEVIESSAACAPMLKYRKPIYLGERQEPMFALRLARKDMDILLRLAAEHGAPARFAALVRNRLAAAEAAGAGERDMAALLELYERPANIFVASFLGSPAMNFLKGRLADDGGPALVLDDRHALRLHAHHRAGADETVVMGIRPHDVVEDEAGGTEATILLVEPTGADTHVTVELAGSRLTCVLPAHFDKVVGDRIKLSFATPKAHFFHAHTKTRLD